MSTLREQCDRASRAFAALKLGDRVRATAKNRIYRIRAGKTYQVFSARGYPHYSVDRQGYFEVPTIAIRVPDPDDEFGGVLSVPAYLLEPMEGDDD